MHDPAAMARAYKEAEASFLLEGRDVTGHELYQALKAKVIAGEMTPDEAHAAILEDYRQRAEGANRHKVDIVSAR
jgi:uncharacterized protein YaaN involved in tellurite resistance